VERTVELLDGGNTIPFIARYRKEATGELDETVIRSLAERLSYLRSLAERKADISRLIAEQGNSRMNLPQVSPKLFPCRNWTTFTAPTDPNAYTRFYRQGKGSGTPSRKTAGTGTNGDRETGRTFSQ